MIHVLSSQIRSQSLPCLHTLVQHSRKNMSANTKCITRNYKFLHCTTLCLGLVISPCDTYDTFETWTKFLRVADKEEWDQLFRCFETRFWSMIVCDDDGVFILDDVSDSLSWTNFPKRSLPLPAKSQVIFIKSLNTVFSHFFALLANTPEPPTTRTTATTTTYYWTTTTSYGFCFAWQVVDLAE